MPDMYTRSDRASLMEGKKEEQSWEVTVRGFLLLGLLVLSLGIGSGIGIGAGIWSGDSGSDICESATCAATTITGAVTCTAQAHTDPVDCNAVDLKDGTTVSVSNAVTVAGPVTVDGAVNCNPVTVAAPVTVTGTVTCSNVGSQLPAAGCGAPGPEPAMLGQYPPSTNTSVSMSKYRYPETCAADDANDYTNPPGAELCATQTWSHENFASEAINGDTGLPWAPHFAAYGFPRKSEMNCSNKFPAAFANWAAETDALPNTDPHKSIRINLEIWVHNLWYITAMEATFLRDEANGAGTKWFADSLLNPNLVGVDAKYVPILAKMSEATNALNNASVTAVPFLNADWNWYSEAIGSMHARAAFSNAPNTGYGTEDQTELVEFGKNFPEGFTRLQLEYVQDGRQQVPAGFPICVTAKDLYKEMASIPYQFSSFACTSQGVAILYPLSRMLVLNGLLDTASNATEKAAQCATYPATDFVSDLTHGFKALDKSRMAMFGSNSIGALSDDDFDTIYYKWANVQCIRVAKIQDSCGATYKAVAGPVDGTVGGDNYAVVEHTVPQVCSLRDALLANRAPLLASAIATQARALFPNAAR